MARLIAILGAASGVSGYGSHVMRSGLRTSAVRMVRRRRRARARPAQPAQPALPRTCAPLCARAN